MINPIELENCENQSGDDNEIPFKNGDQKRLQEG